MNKLKVVFFGTPDFAVPSLDILNNHPNVDIQAVISMPDRPSGRGHQIKSPEVIEYAKINKLNFFQSENINKDKNFKDVVRDADVFIVLAFAQFLSQEVLDTPTLGCFNIHTSLLPKYRGAAPIQYALLNGDESTGVSIQRMVKKMDAGNICYSKEIKVNLNETGGQLFTRLKLQAGLALNDFIYDILNNEVKEEAQNENLASFAPTLKREDGFLDFKNETIKNITNKVRALYPWPGTYCHSNNKRIKIFNVEKSNTELEPGKTLITKQNILIGCKDSTIRIKELQLEGKRRSYDHEIVNGLKPDFKINEDV